MDVNVDCDENVFRNLNTFLREFPQRNRAKQMTTTILILRTRFEFGFSKPQKYFYVPNDVTNYFNVFC